MYSTINNPQDQDSNPQSQKYEDLGEFKSTDKGSMIMEEFQKAGIENEWLSNFVNEVESEVQTLDTEIEEIKYEISKYKGLVSTSSNNREIMMQRLNSELESARSEAK